LSVAFPGALKWLALFGALYGSLKAFAQVRVPELIAYAGLALFSVFWCAIAASPNLATVHFIYAGAVALLSAGLLLAWQFLRKRYGDLDLGRFHGLARPMPRFATLYSLLVMAAVGLPPYAIFSAQAKLLLQPTLAISWGFAVILVSWFLASWYLMRMMQHLLFGRNQIEIRYTDLRAGETAWLVLLIALLIGLGAMPTTWLETDFTTQIHRIAMEPLRWHR
jgi:NADH-quinone oxidoreductase subunit M